MLNYVNDLGSERRLRLFAHACCSHVQHLLLDTRLLDAFHGIERRAEGKCEDAESGRLNAEAGRAVHEIEASLYGPDGVLQANDLSSAACAVFCASNPSYAPTRLASHSSSAIGSVVFWVQGALAHPVWKATRDRTKTDEARESEERLQVAILRDIFGNPFRAAVAPPKRASIVAALAQLVYDDRAFDRLPILADALEDAGCTDAAILEHLRGPGPHVRGCWALDLVLGKT
jgi:hypothetical protein